MEYFTVVPEDLFRTVLFSRARPFTFARDPKATNPWTSVSPLHCAGFTFDELRLPWLVVNPERHANGDFKVRGLSLKSWDDNTSNEKDLEDEIANPFGDADKNDKKGTYRLALDKALEMEGWWLPVLCPQK